MTDKLEERILSSINGTEGLIKTYEKGYDDIHEGLENALNHTFPLNEGYNKKVIDEHIIENKEILNHIMGLKRYKLDLYLKLDEHKARKHESRRTWWAIGLSGSALVANCLLSIWAAISDF